MYKQVYQKPAHFLNAQMSVLSNSFSVFLVLGMYNFGCCIETADKRIFHLFCVCHQQLFFFFAFFANHIFLLTPQRSSSLVTDMMPSQL